MVSPSVICKHQPCLMLFVCVSWKWHLCTGWKENTSRRRRTRVFLFLCRNHLLMSCIYEKPCVNVLYLWETFCKSFAFFYKIFCKSPVFLLFFYLLCNLVSLVEKVLIGIIFVKTFCYFWRQLMYILRNLWSKIVTSKTLNKKTLILTVWQISLLLSKIKSRIPIF